MNSLERMQAALRREEPDKVPIVEWEVHPKVIAALLPGATLYEFIEQMGLDAICVTEDVPWEDVAPGVRRDQFGILRDFREMAGLNYPFPLQGPIEREEDLDTYVPPDPHDPRRLASLRDAVLRFKGKKAIIFSTAVGFLYGSWLRGTENLLMDYVLNPDFALRVTNVATDYYVELVQHAIEAGADIILDGDDYCGKNGPFMSPAHFERFVLPALQRFVNVVKERKVPFIKHCDGYVWPILRQMIDTGIDAINPMEPIAGMDIGEVKRTYGDRVAVVGNIDCAQLLTFGTPEEVRAAVKECVRVASPGGGHILASSNVVHAGVKPENYAAMLQAAREFGTYPIQL